MVSVFEKRSKEPQGSAFERRAKTNGSSESFGKSLARTAYQIPSGIAQAESYPLDILQALGTGYALDPEEIEHLRKIHEREGIPFDEEEYIRNVQKASSAFPTQGNIERMIEEETGLPLTAKNKLQKGIKLGSSAAKLTPGSLTQKAISGMAAPVVSEVSQAVGIPEPIAEILALGTSGGISKGKIKEKVLNAEQRNLRNIAAKHDLPTYAGMEVEGTPKIQPIISQEKQNLLKKELSKSSEKAIDKIISEQLPVNKAQRLGINPEEVYERSYKRMNETAKEIDGQIAKGTKKPINIQPVLNWIKKEVKEIKKTAPSLSTPDKIKLNILKQEYKSLSNKPKKQPNESIKLIDVTGKPFPSKKKIRSAKEINASQAIDQTRNYNENVRDLYKKSEFTGAQQEVRETYAQLNNQFQNAIRKSGEKDLARQLWFGNQVFNETSKVDQITNILKPAFENGYDSSKMANLLRTKNNRKFLERLIGKNSLKDLVNISHYGKKAEKLVFDRVKNPKTLGEYLTTMTPLKAGLIFLKHGASVGLGTAYEIGQATSKRIAGLLFTRPGTRKAYVNFLKGASENKEGMFAKASKELSKKIEEEFGSEENLKKMVTQKED